jgi:hypothetical protein
VPAVGDWIMALCVAALVIAAGHCASTPAAFAISPPITINSAIANFPGAKLFISKLLVAQSQLDPRHSARQKCTPDTRHK